MKYLLIITAVFLLTMNISVKGFCENTGKEVLLATTTSISDTGLLELSGEIFRKKTGYILKPLAVGTGQALTMASKGEVDIVIVHSEKAEKEFMNKGYGSARERIMHNFFIIAGPPEDPAKIKSCKKALEAFQKIGKGKFNFISRGDESGTNNKELELWEKAGIKPEGAWYIETGQGMGQTLQIANEKNAYTLTDTGTFLYLKKNLQIIALLNKNTDLINIYSAITVNQEKFPSVNKKGARAFLDFLLSHDTQKIIENFGVKEFGSPLFIPDRL
jgi:tungstate transport system substrate-binding protein